MDNFYIVSIYTYLLLTLPILNVVVFSKITLLKFLNWRCRCIWAETNWYIYEGFSKRVNGSMIMY